MILRSNVHLYFEESLINDHENVSKILQENDGSQHLDNDTVTVAFSNSDRSSFEVLLDICGVIHFNSDAAQQSFQNHATDTRDIYSYKRRSRCKIVKKTKHLENAFNDLKSLVKKQIILFIRFFDNSNANIVYEGRIISSLKEYLKKMSFEKHYSLLHSILDKIFKNQLQHADIVRWLARQVGIESSKSAT